MNPGVGNTAEFYNLRILSEWPINSIALHMSCIY